MRNFDPMQGAGEESGEGDERGDPSLKAGCGKGAASSEPRPLSFPASGSISPLISCPVIPHSSPASCIGPNLATQFFSRIPHRHYLCRLNSPNLYRSCISTYETWPAASRSR